MKLLVVCAVAMLVACSSGGTDNAGSSGGDPPSGFYTLTITTTGDTCTPARVTGDQGTMLVSATANVVNIPLPFVQGSPGRQDIPWSGTSINDFEGCTGSKIDLSIANRSNSSIEVDVAEHWQGVAACPGKSDAPFGVPSSDCTATRKFQFTLVKPCPATVGGVTCS